MSRVWLRASLALWDRRERYRKRRHDHWQRLVDQHHRAGDVLRRDHWSKLLTQARARVALRERQLRKRQPAIGIDISNNNGAVDWHAVRRAGYTFAWLKASEGASFVDKTFLGHVEAAQKAGLKVGAYHFVSSEPAAAQAKLFASRIKAAALGFGDLLPAADIEKAGVTTGQASAFIDAVHRELRVKPVVYTFPGFEARWPSTFGCKLWIAHFDVAKPTVPRPWTAYAVWQHSSHARVPGVSGDCDVNKTPDLTAVVW